MADNGGVALAEGGQTRPRIGAQVQMARGKFGERRRELMARADVGGDVVMAATKVLRGDASFGSSQQQSKVILLVTDRQSCGIPAPVYRSDLVDGQTPRPANYRPCTQLGRQSLTDAVASIPLGTFQLA